MVSEVDYGHGNVGAGDICAEGEGELEVFHAATRPKVDDKVLLMGSLHCLS